MNKQDLEYLEKTYPQLGKQARTNFKQYQREVMGKVKTYLQKKESLVFQRSQEDLFILGFPQEACIVSRVVLEDALRRRFNPSSKKRLNTIINEVDIDNETKRLALLIKDNGDIFAHENWRRKQSKFPKKEAKLKAIESAKALNKILVNLGYKEPELRME